MQLAQINEEKEEFKRPRTSPTRQRAAFRDVSNSPKKLRLFERRLPNPARVLVPGSPDSKCIVVTPVLGKDRLKKTVSEPVLELNEPSRIVSSIRTFTRSSSSSIIPANQPSANQTSANLKSETPVRNRGKWRRSQNTLSFTKSNQK
jgi:hypothetical protein